MPVIPFSSASRISRDAQAASDLQDQQSAEQERRYREGADAKLKELRANGVKKFNPNAEPIGTIPDPVPAGGPRINAPGVETPDPYHTPGGIFSDNYQPQEGDALWNQFESDRTGANADIGYVDLPEQSGQSADGVGGPDKPVTGLTAEEIASFKEFMQKRDDQSASLRTRGALLGQTSTPDQAAEALDLANRTGANRAEVEGDVDTFRKLDVVSQLDTMRKTAPKLRSWLDDPINLEVAHDDIPSMGFWEQIGEGFARTDELKAGQTGNKGAGLGALTDYPLRDNFSPGVANAAGVVEGGKAIGQSLAAGYATTSSGVAGLLRTASEFNDQFSSWVAGRPIESGASQYLGRLQTAAQSAAADWHYQSDDPTIQGLLSGVESLPTSAFVVAATIVTGGAASPFVGAAVGGALTYGDKYGEMRAQGANPWDSAGVALAQGILETAFEIPELKFLVGDMEHGVPFLQMMFKQAAVQVITENGATLTQDFVDWRFLPENKGKPFSEYLNGRFMAAYQTSLAALVGTTVQTTGAKALDVTMQKIDEGYQQKRAEDLANFMKAMGDNAANSKLLKRMPEKWREMVAHVTKGGVKENVLISPVGINELAQTVGVKPEQLATALHIDPAKMAADMEAGDYVSVPIGDYAALIQTAKKDIGVSGEQIYGALEQHIKFNDKEDTQAEHKVRVEEWDKLNALQADMEVGNDFESKAARVRNDARARITAMGKFNSDTSAIQARIASDGIIGIALRENLDPEELWNQYKIDYNNVVGGKPTTGELPQTVELPEDATPTQRLIDMRAKGSSNAEIATALYPDVDTPTALNRVKALASKNKAKIEERKAELSPARQKELAQTKAAGFSGMNLFEKNIINLYSKAQLDSLVHEHAHFYLKVLEHMNRTSETPLPFVVSQLSAIRSAFGKHQEFEIYDANGQITPEGIEVQELFAESFGIHFMTGKAPSAEMRGIFATIKQWMFDLYKTVKNGIRQAIINDGNPYLKNRIGAAEGRMGRSMTDQELVEFVLPEELRNVFDRAIASDEAIIAERMKIDVDANQLAQAMLDKKVITQRQFEKAKERLLAAKLVAQDELRARMIDEYIRSKRAPWRAEERELEAEFAKEVDALPNQRHYQLMSGEGWIDTEAGEAADLAAQSQATENAHAHGASLAQWFHSGTIGPQDAIDVTRGELGFHVGSKQSAEIRSRDWPSQQQTISEFDIAGEFTRVPDMGQWGPDDYLEARRRSSVFDENLEPMWKELDALAKRDPGMPEWTAAVQDAAKRHGISGWEYRNVQEGGGMSRIVMDPQAISRRQQGGELAQSQTHDPKGERELDALGFYSSVQEAAKSVSEGIWQLGWQAARNALAKGRGTTRPTFEELDQLGIDDAVAQAELEAGQPLKGAELAALVADIIDANRIMMERADAIFDPAKARAAIRKMNKQQLWDALDSDTRGWMASQFVNARVENGVRTFTLDTSSEDAIVLEFKESDITAGYSGDPMRISSVDIPIYRRHGNLIPRLVETITIRTYGALDPKTFEDKKVLLEDVRYSLRVRMGQLFAELGDETVIRKTLREDMVDSVSLADRGALGDRASRHDPGDYDVDSEVKYGEIRMMLPVRFHEQLTGSTHSGEPGEVINILWSVRKDADGKKSLFLRQLQSDEGQQLRLEKQAVLDRREENISLLIKAGYSRAEAEEDFNSEVEAMSRVPLMARTSLWVNAGVRALVFEAAKTGMSSVSVPTAQTSTIIQGNADAAQHYETNVKGALEKIARQFNAEVKLSTVQSADNPDGASVYTMQITPEMRRKIVSEGFPLFQTRTGKDRIAQPASIPAMRLNLAAVKEQYGDAAVAALPPTVRAYSTNATDADDFLREGRAAVKTAKKDKPKSLWKFLSTQNAVGGVKYSGIRDTDGEILAIIGEKKAARGLIASGEDTKFGRSYDIEHAARVAWEAGYFNTESPPTPREFLDALRNDFDGQAKLYARDDVEKAAQIDSAQQWVDWFEENEIDLNETNDALLHAQIAIKLSGTNENAVGPDEAAAIFNGHFKRQVFKDGKDFLDSLQEGTKRNKIIKDMVNAEMIKRHGDIFNDGTIMQEAEAYARNELLARADEIELEALANAVGQQAAANMTREMAKERLREKQVREVLNYHQWLTLEQRWMAKAVKAAEAGKMAEALEFKRLAMINRAMFTEGKKLAEKIEKDVTFFKSFEKKDKRIKLAKAGMDYLDQMDQLLENIELRKRPAKLLRERASLADWFAQKQAQIDPLLDRSSMSDDERMAAELEEIERSDALAALQQDAELRNYKSMTVEELSTVRDQADMIVLAARRAGALMVEGEHRLIHLVMDEIEERLIAVKPEELPPQSLASYAPKEVSKRQNQEFRSDIRTMQAIIRIIDGDDNGPLARYTIHKLNTSGALGLERVLLEEDKVIALFREAYGTNLDELRKDKIDIPGVSVPMAKMERLTVALYMGTEISRKRMRDGEGWDDNTLQAIINTLDQNDWAFVSSVWEYVNSLYPEAAEAHLDVHGIPLSKQPGLKIVTRFGVIQGDYFPIAYDPHRSSRADQNAIVDEAKKITGKVGTRKATSSTKERVKGKVTLPVLMDLSITLGAHVREVVGNITTQKSILDVGRVIAHPRMQKLIVSRYGWVTYKTLLSAMKDTRNGVAGARGPTERIAVRVRNGATNVTLGLNVGTIVKQMLGFSNSIVRLGGKSAGPIGGAYWMIRGATRMGFSAKGLQNGVAYIAKRSPYMRMRMKVQTQAIADQQRQINNGKIRSDIKRITDIVSMFMIQRVQYLGIDCPTWLGAHAKFIANGMSEEDAVASADQVVIDSQGSGEYWQVSAFQRGGPIQRIFTNYMTAAIATKDMAVNATKETNFRNPGQVIIWAMNIGVLMTLPVVLTMAVTQALRPGGDGDDDEPYLERLAREEISWVLGSLGLLGQLSGAAADFAYRGPQGTRIFNEASKAIQEAFTGAEHLFAGKATASDAIDVLRPANLAAGIWFGYPAAALDRFVRGADAMMKGETDDPRALVSGPPRN